MFFCCCSYFFVHFVQLQKGYIDKKMSSPCHDVVSLKKRVELWKFWLNCPFYLNLSFLLASKGIQKSATYLETSAEMVQMLNFEYALLLTLCTVTVVWPETSVPSQTAPVHREPSNCQCCATTTRTSAACVSCTYVCVCVCVLTHMRSPFIPPHHH